MLTNRVQCHHQVLSHAVTNLAYDRDNKRCVLSTSNGQILLFDLSINPPVL